MSGDLDSAARARVNALFHQAVDLSAAARAALLDRECPREPAIRKEVESLLAAHDRAANFLVLPAVIPAADADPPDRPSDAARLVGRSFGQYEIRRVLGEGGMGVVYLADDHRLLRTVAMKAISSKVAADPERRERLRREASAAAQIIHPGVAVVHVLEEFGDNLFIVSEFVAGETLREEMSRGPAPARKVLDAAIELARALAAAHDEGVTHRDLKPENVMRKPDGILKILDFGLARMRDTNEQNPRLTDKWTLLGTPAYMSPEQIRRGRVDGRSDLFALGIMLSEMLSGVHPFAGQDSAATMVNIIDAEPIIPAGAGEGSSDVSIRHGLVGIIRVLLRKDSTARFASAHVLAAALERIRDAERVSYPGTSGMEPETRRWWRIHQVTASVAYAALLVPIGLAGRWRGDRGVGVIVFLVALAAAVAAVTLRMHLLFAAKSLPEEWAHQHASSRRWLRVADLAFVASLAAAGLSVYSERDDTLNVLASILVGAAMLVLLGATVIEPATTRAAFGPPRQSAGAS